MSVNKGAGHSFNGQSIGVWAHWFGSLLSGGISGDAEVPRHSIFMMVYPCTEEHSLNGGGGQRTRAGRESKLKIMFPLWEKKKSTWTPSYRYQGNYSHLSICEDNIMILWDFWSCKLLSSVCEIVFYHCFTPDAFSYNQKTEHITLDSRDDLSLLAGCVVDLVFQMDLTLFAPHMLGWTPVPCVSLK